MVDLRFVIDTNVLVSAILLRSSIPDRAFARARDQGKILLSDETLQELEEILHRAKFDKYIALSLRLQFIAKLKLETERVPIKSVFKNVEILKITNFWRLPLTGRRLI
jgi:uncharacterized protein